jgi:hypothetical protein
MGAATIACLEHAGPSSAPPPPTAHPPPSAPQASPGSAVEVFVTYLTPPLQQRMHETEGAYDLLRLDGVALLEGRALAAWTERDHHHQQQQLQQQQRQQQQQRGAMAASAEAAAAAPGPVNVVSSVFQYNSSVGTLHLPLAGDGRESRSPIALAEIPCKNRR